MSNDMENMEVEPIIVEGNDPVEHSYNQAAVFLEDAFQFRSIHHKVDETSLKLYRLYFSRPIRWGLGMVIFLDLALAFFEKPSSLTLSSDPRSLSQRPVPPCGLTEGLEMLLLACFICDVVIKSHFVGQRQFIRSKWLLVYCLVLVVSFVDIFVSLSGGCTERIRVRRLLRPFFLLQNSSLMKKLLRAIKRTVPEIMSVLFLLFLHLWFFTMFGMLLFPQESANGTIAKKACALNSSSSGAACEGFLYYPRLEISLRSLFVLLTTANNPDVMMPVYMKNRFSALYFILFTIIGLYFLLNMLTAVIYNQFRGYVTGSIQSSFFRRRLAIRASFHVLLSLQDPDSEVPLGHVGIQDVRRTLQLASIGKRCSTRVARLLERNTSGHLNAKDFQTLFDARESRVPYRPAMSFVENSVMRKVQIIVAHKCFDYFGDFVALVNVLMMSVYLDYEYDRLWKSSKSDLAAANMIFVLYYLLEQLLKLWAVGWQRYRSSKTSLYCGVMTVLLVMIEIIHLALYGAPFHNHKDDDGDAHEESYYQNVGKVFSLSNMFRVLNMLIIFRLLRIIPNIKALSLVAETLVNLLKNLRPFVGIIVAIYYVFAVLGMMLFEGVTDPKSVGLNFTREAAKECGTFSQLQYYANNFNDFAAALVLLWELMVVNNWHVFLKEYSKAVNSWSQLYFVAWFLISVVLCINLFVALILEAFVNQWEMKQRRNRTPSLSSTTQQGEGPRPRFHELFSDDVVEPQESELIGQLRSHEYYHFPLE